MGQDADDRRYRGRDCLHAGSGYWQHLSAGLGAKGPRLRDLYYLELVNLEAEAEIDANHGEWTRDLLIRRHIADGELAFFSTWCQVGTAIETLAQSKGITGRSKTVSRSPRNELGLDHNETRSWHGWHRHVTLVMLAFAMMAAIRHHGEGPYHKTDAPAYNKPPGLIRWSIQEIRRIANRIGQKRIRPAHVIAWSL